MAERREQVRPLAPASAEHTGSSDDDERAMQVVINKEEFRRRRCIKCCGGILAFLLIEVVVMLILIFAVFRVKEPIIKLNAVVLNHIDLVNVITSTPASNMILTAEISFKNPNYSSFKYKSTTTTLFYHDKTIIGKAQILPGKVKARRTIRKNITVDVITDQLIRHPMFATEMRSGLITMTSYTKGRGKVKMIKLINKRVKLEMNCSISVNTTTSKIQNQNCDRKVEIF